jgi:hypothetical protein
MFGTILTALLWHMEVNYQRHAPAAIQPEKDFGTPLTAAWVGPKAGLKVDTSYERNSNSGPPSA